MLLVVPSVGLSNPFVWIETFTFRTLFCAKTFTGSHTSSSGPSTLGRVESVIRSLFTATVFSALPYAPSPPATTITRTDPTYWGRRRVCVLASPPFKAKGPINWTMGLKRFTLSFDGFKASSPPMPNSGPIVPLWAPKTRSNRSQVRTPNASRA